MHKVNRVLLLFLGVIIFSFIGIWSFLQSDSFGTILSGIINEYSQRAGIEVKVKKVNFTFFPPGGVIEGVRFQHFIDENSIEAELDELVLQLGFWDLWNEEPHIQNIEFRRGVVELKGDWAQSEIDKEENKSKQFDLTKDFKRLQNIIELLPVRISSLGMNNVNFKAINDKYQVFFKDLELKEKKDHYRVKLEAYPKVPLRSFKEPILIDQIWGTLEFDSNNLRINDINFQLGLNTLQVKGEVKNYLTKDKLNLNLNGKINAHINDLENFINIGNQKIFTEGLGDLDYTFTGNLQKFSGNIKGSLIGVDTKYINSNRANIEAFYNKDQVRIDKLKTNYGAGEIELRKPFVFLDFKNNVFLPDILLLQAKNTSLQNVLRGVPVLKSLRGRFSGPVSLRYKKDHFQILAENTLLFKDLRLQTDQKIIEVEKTQTTLINVDLRNDQLFLGLNFDSPALIANIEGTVKDGLSRFNALNALVDFDKIHFLDRKLELHGQGALRISANTSSKEQRLALEGTINNASVLKFNLAKLSTKLEFIFHKGIIKFDQLLAQYGQDAISGAGEINYKMKTQDLKFKVSKMNYKNFYSLIEEYVKDIEYFPASVHSKLSGFVNLSGGLELPRLILDGRLYANGGEYFQEKFSYAYTDLHLEQERILLNNMLIKKSNSDITGAFSYNLKSKIYDFKYGFNNLSTQDINFFKKYLPNWSSALSGEFAGTNKFGSHLSFLFDFTPSVINGEKFDKSNLKFKIDDNIYKLNGNFLGDQLAYDIKIDTLEKANSNLKKSSIKIDAKVSELDKLISVFPRDYLNLVDFSAAIHINNDIDFNYNDWTKVRLKSQVAKLLLSTDQMSLNYVSTSPQFVVEDGSVKKWNFKARGENIDLSSQASGELGRGLTVKNNVEFDLSILSALFRKIQRASGVTTLEHTIAEDKSIWSQKVKLKSNAFNLATDLIPFNFKIGSFEINYQKAKLQINEFLSELNEGQMSAKGDINLTTFPPTINVQYSLDHAGLSLFRKSKLFLSGNGAILGRKLPYVFSGDLIINRSYIFDEFQNISDDNQSYIQEVKYLPESQRSSKSRIAQLNIDLKTDSYIAISNSVTDSKVRAQGNLTGSFQKYYFDGIVKLAGGRNKVYFKGAEYTIRKMDLILSSDREMGDPEIDIWASSIISDYAIDIKAYGRKDDLNFSLSSEPNLSQNDIISLIVFGYTNKISNDLSTESREALTRAGIGSFVFDQIGLNKTLKREFGLQLSLGTEFQNEEDLLNQKTNGLGRIRSATKIEVKKDISDRVDLSLSTTVGGNIGETRSMNLNYDLKENVSVQGVYEIITNEQGDESRVDNSAGADLKFRWEFK